MEGNNMRKDTRDPEEQKRDAQEILDEMKLCRYCHDHMPCGCDGARYGVMRNGQPVEKGIDTI